MSKPKYLKYTDVEQIIKDNALQYLVMIGQRSNGKSYATKELLIRKALKGELFTYLRRRKEDIQDYMVVEYFADMVIPDDKGKSAILKITRGKYNAVKVLKKSIYLTDDREDKEDKEPDLLIGYAHALSEVERLKSRQFPAVQYIAFEEFIATGLYLWEEPSKLQGYVSSIFRNRPGTVIMIGNTISRVCPYFTEWSLDRLPKQAQGSLELYTYHTDDVETRIGVFLCGTLNQNSGMFFGAAAKMIVGGMWDREEQPRLDKDRVEYNTLYTMVFDFSKQACFLMSFLQLKTDHTKMLWYVEPKTTEIKKYTRVISPAVNESRLYTQDFIPINDREKVLMSYFKEGKIAYSDNLTGTEFLRCIAQLHKR